MHDDVADGIDIQIWDAHIMDIMDDRYKVHIVGDDRNSILLEMPLVKHPFHAHYKYYGAKAKSLPSSHHAGIHKQNCMARNEILEDPDRLQQFWHISVPGGSTLTCEHFPYQRETVGDEAK